MTEAFIQHSSLITRLHVTGIIALQVLQAIQTVRAGKLHFTESTRLCIWHPRTSHFWRVHTHNLSFLKSWTALQILLPVVFFELQSVSIRVRACTEKSLFFKANIKILVWKISRQVDSIQTFFLCCSGYLILTSWSRNGKQVIWIAASFFDFFDWVFFIFYFVSLWFMFLQVLQLIDIVLVLLVLLWKLLHRLRIIMLNLPGWSISEFSSPIELQQLPCWLLLPQWRLQLHDMSSR